MVNCIKRKQGQLAKKKNNRFSLYKSETKDIGGVSARAAAEQEDPSSKFNKMNFFGAQQKSITDGVDNLSNMMRIEFTIYDENDRQGYTAHMMVDRTTEPDIEKMVATYLTIMGKDPKDYNLA